VTPTSLLTDKLWGADRC